MENELHVVFGAGPLGRSVMERLAADGKKVRMVSRSQPSDLPEGIEHTAADLMTGAGVDAAASGATVIYQCINPPYHRWPQEFPTMQRAIVAAAQKTGAVLVAAENLYAYGDTHGLPMTESMPYNAHTRKGMVRARITEELLSAHRDGSIRAVIGRASDFFGPFVLNSMMGERQFGFALAGKKASLVGNIDVPHSFTFIKDFGTALVRLGAERSSYGRAWHVPTAPPVTQRQFIETVFRLIDRPTMFSTMGRTMLTIGGLFIPAARESIEMLYEFERAFVMDSSDYEQTFGVSATPLEQALQETIVWYQNRRTKG